MKFHKYDFFLTFLFIVTFLDINVPLLFGTTISTSSQPKNKIINLGLASNFSEISTSTSNPFSNYFREGVSLALENSKQKLNKIGLEVITKEFNYGVDVVNSLKAAELAVKSDVIAVVGYNRSSFALLAAPLHQKGKLPMITPSATADRLSEMGPYIHSACFNNAFMANILARLAIKKLKAKTVASVVVQDCAYCKDFAKSFNKEFILNGGKILEEIPILESGSDLDAVASKVKLLNPDVIFLPNQGFLPAQIISKILKNGFNKPFLGGDGWGNDGQQFFDVIGNYSFEGYSLSHWHYDLKDSASVKFLNQYTHKFKKYPNDITVLAYDATLLFVEALVKAKTFDRQGLENSLSSIKEFNGVTGKFLFLPKGETKKSVVLLTTKNKKFVFKEQIQPSL